MENKVKDNYETIKMNCYKEYQKNRDLLEVKRRNKRDFMKEKYIVAKPFFTYIVKYLDNECCELSKIEDCMEYIESQLLIDEDLRVEDFSICIKKNYKEIKLTNLGKAKLDELRENKFMKEKYLKLLNNYICGELIFWGSADHLSALKILRKCKSKLQEYDYINALNSDELDLLSNIAKYNNYSKKNWNVNTILDKLESVIERKVK